MPTSLTIAAHVATIMSAGTALLDDALAAGFTARVPTCNGWTAAHLVAHQAMVHQWATAQITGGDPGAVPDQTTLRSMPDLADRYRDGLISLTTAIEHAPDDLQALVFLNDAPPARAFWARRQAHETTIHAADAAAARLGRVPAAGEFAVGGPLAVDGIDELVRGFLTRGRSKLYDGTRCVMAVELVDEPQRWHLVIDEQLTVIPDGSEPDEPIAVTVSGTAADVYLALWNRGSAIEVSGDHAVVQRWRENQRIRWS